MADIGLGTPLQHDGINPARALILHAYWGLRRSEPAEHVGTHEIADWIEAHEPTARVPSPSLIQLTLEQAAVEHRKPGRPCLREAAPPFCPRPVLAKSSRSPT